MSTSPTLSPEVRLQAARARVLSLEQSLGRRALDPDGRPLTGEALARRREEIKAKLAVAVQELRAAKVEMGPSIARSRSEILAAAYRVLTRLDDEGTEIGSDGHAVLEAIESAVPSGVLLKALGEEAAE
jgi:hypothetical protein